MCNSSPSILLVDDEPINLRLLEDLLASAGYSTWSATSGQEALNIVQEFTPDLVILDVMMPEIDGFEVCDRFRQHEQLKTVPIIFLTALDDEESKLKAMEKMGDDYITKPFNSRLLLAKVASLIQLQTIRHQSNQAKMNKTIKETTKRQLSAAWEINEYLSEKFRLFVPEQFLNRIAPKGIQSIRLGNVTEEELTVLFCDIRDFTAIAESQNPRETFEWLNSFFNKMSGCISVNHGFIDKYLGDAIMAVFDRPESHGQDAVKAALMMQQNLQEFNQHFYPEKIRSPIAIGIGINTGVGMIGTLGSEYRMDSTVIGDVVNTASRLEGLTKQYGCTMIVSESTLEQIRQQTYWIPDFSEALEGSLPFPIQGFYTRWIDCITPRGKQNSLNIYELLGTPNTMIFPQKILTLLEFERGINAWKEQDYETALTSFKTVFNHNPNDTIASLYIQRCKEQLELKITHHPEWNEGAEFLTNDYQLKP